ncbi:hypothetical protein RFI_16690 [Reticulomyxa filosa]|uniref:Histidine kinase/HSP90-like ATPase domain-containing protein n=1 Tax=Reticulomyxa filosa TaxID=46433 RepID=X6N2N9_RETFI|nr:hypothetical protein RFI_16690 [Reticulomyxa filosa]|eukprot:ETO20530.1 hypothetical protein RFI_16690 [Reticulomyxa filosa]
MSESNDMPHAPTTENINEEKHQEVTALVSTNETDPANNEDTEAKKHWKFSSGQLIIYLLHTNPELFDKEKDIKIKMIPDPDEKMTIRDSGIGMMKEDLVNKLTEGTDIFMIISFYRAYLEKTVKKIVKKLLSQFMVFLVSLLTMKEEEKLNKDDDDDKCIGKAEEVEIIYCELLNKQKPTGGFYESSINDLKEQLAFRNLEKESLCLPLPEEKKVSFFYFLKIKNV